MARESATFRWTSEALSDASRLTPLEARGTVRLALRHGGLDAQSVGPSEMLLVLQEILPGMLMSRGIDGGESICQELERGLHTQDLNADLHQQATRDVTLARLFS